MGRRQTAGAMRTDLQNRLPYGAATNRVQVIILSGSKRRRVIDGAGFAAGYVAHGTEQAKVIRQGHGMSP